ncbi:Receptor-like protein kinase [Quillaja saponaria]|uniref:Receptor-like protein kinase n=1 Tax=Quillaja saponaria TaxID=32244 RepID=A0AAD7P8N2_QUISA|nr:Receptor-like protein kinase [Quillaja saponaria]
MPPAVMVSTTPPRTKTTLATRLMDFFSVVEMSQLRHAKTVFPKQQRSDTEVSNLESVHYLNRFIQLLEETLQTVVNQASNGGAEKKFSTKEAKIDSFQTLYTLGQCIPGFSVLDCNRRLQIAVDNLPVSGKPRLCPENYSHCCCNCYTPVEISSVESLQFDLVTIKSATNNFSDENKLGEGGFGTVYKGSLSNGQDIAVKRLSTRSRQGAEEFKNEVVLVAKLQHINLTQKNKDNWNGQDDTRS